jgi:hypothetical protein
MMEGSDNEQDQEAVASANVPIIALPVQEGEAAAAVAAEQDVPCVEQLSPVFPARAMKQATKPARKKVPRLQSESGPSSSSSSSSSGEDSSSSSSGEDSESGGSDGDVIVRVKPGNESNDVEIDDDEEAIQTQLVSSPTSFAAASSSSASVSSIPPMPMPMSVPVLPVVPMGAGGSMETNLLHVSAGLANMTQILQTFMGGVAQATKDNAEAIRKSIKQQKKAEKRSEKRFNRMQKEMLSEMRRQAIQLDDLKSGLAMRASNMDCGLDNIMLRQELSKVLDFIARFGMDTRTGYVVAFPVMVSNEVCVAVSLHLLSYALTAMLPFATRGVKEFTLAGLRTLMSLIKTESVKNANAQQFYSLFAVDEYTGLKARQASNNIQAWRVYKASVFVRALQMACRSDSAKFLELEEEPSALSWGGKRRMMFSQESVKYREMSGRMSWGHVVQEEVLALPQVRSFFDIVRANGGATGTGSGSGGASSASASASGSSLSSSSSSGSGEHEQQTPFHFCGLHKELTAPVLPHAELVRRLLRDQRREREREEAEQLMSDDRIDREYVGGRSVRKRKAASSPARATTASASTTPAARTRRASARARPGTGKQPRLVPLQAHGLAQAVAAAKAQAESESSSAGDSSSGSGSSSGSESDSGSGNRDDDEEALVPAAAAASASSVAAVAPARRK